MREDQPARDRRSTALVYATVAYAVTLTIHTADHFRRGTDAVTPEVLWLGSAGTLAGIVAIGLVVVGHRAAAAVAVVVGLGQALGVALVHFGPSLGAYSDPLVGAGAQPLTIAAAAAETLAALAMGLAGAHVQRRRARTISG